MIIEVSLENMNFKVINNEGTKCVFCNKKLKPIGLDYLYANADQNTIEYERCNCNKAIEFWKQYDLKQSEKEIRKKCQETISKIYKNNYMKKKVQYSNFVNFDINEDNKEAVVTLIKYSHLCVENNIKDGVIIYGNIGYDNSHLAASIANEIIRNNKIVLIERTSSITDKIKETFNRNDITETEIIELYSNVDMLIIDDLGSETISKRTLEKLYKIINNRYQNELPIVITTVYTRAELMEQIAIENKKLAEEFIQILYKMCYEISLIKNDLNTKEKASISDQTKC